MPSWDHEDLKNKAYNNENLNEFSKKDVQKLQKIETIKWDLDSVLNTLSKEELEQLNNSNFIEEFKRIVSLKIQNEEKIDPIQVVNELSKLSWITQEIILKDILLYSDRKIKEYQEDFGFNMYGIILRDIKNKGLIKDLKIAIDQEKEKWLEEIWNICKKYTFTEEVIQYLKYNQIKITEKQLNFLKDLSQKEHEAIRLLASLVEDKYIENETQFFVSLFHNDDPHIRAAAVEAIWQCNDKSALNDIETLYRNDKNNHVKMTCEHVMKILTQK